MGSFRQSRGVDLRSEFRFVRTDPDQNQNRLRQLLQQLDAETLVLLITQAAELSERYTFSRQTKRGARFGA